MHRIRALVTSLNRSAEGASIRSPGGAQEDADAQQQQSSAQRAQRLASQTSGMMGQMQEQLLGGPPAAAEPLSGHRLSDAIGQLLETYGAAMPGNEEVFLRTLCACHVHDCTPVQQLQGSQQHAKRLGLQVQGSQVRECAGKPHPLSAGKEAEPHKAGQCNRGPPVKVYQYKPF